MRHHLQELLEPRSLPVVRLPRARLVDHLLVAQARRRRPLRPLQIALARDALQIATLVRSLVRGGVVPRRGEVARRAGAAVHATRTARCRRRAVAAPDLVIGPRRRLLVQKQLLLLVTGVASQLAAEQQPQIRLDAGRSNVAAATPVSARGLRPHLLSDPLLNISLVAVTVSGAARRPYHGLRLRLLVLRRRVATWGEATDAQVRHRWWLRVHRHCNGQARIA